MDFDPLIRFEEKRTWSRWISTCLDWLSAPDALGFLFSMFFGIGCSSYVIASWTGHFLRQGNYVAAFCLVLGSLLIVGAAFLRIPIALIIIFGGAAAVSVAFLGNSASLLMP